MQPVRLSISGKYWDSHIYAGRLYLFGQDGSLTAINWDRLVSDATISLEVGFAAETAFKRSDYFYGAQWSLLFQDPGFRDLLRRRFNLLADQSIRLSQRSLKEYVLWQRDSPFPFPHADATIYGHHFFGAGRSGLWQSFKPNRRGPYEEAEKLWDCPSLAVDGNYGAVAVAAGPEGLFELDLDFDMVNWEEDSQEPELVSASLCTQLAWTYGDLYGSSTFAPGFFVKVWRGKYSDRPVRPTAPAKASLRYSSGNRILSHSDEVIYELAENEVFGRSTGQFSWAGRDKLCQHGGNSVRIVKYNPWSKTNDPFSLLGDYKLRTDAATVISAQVAPFGIILEHDRGLEVMLSDGSVTTIRGEPVRWRVFPRSKYYENQLHVIRSDRLDVLSFNHDYFVDQKQKVFGSRVTARRSNRP
jgi:hypothetical protein